MKHSFKSYLLVPDLIKTFHSKFNGNVNLYSYGGQYRIEIGGLIQSGQIMSQIWRQAVSKLLPRDQKPKSILLLGFGCGSSAHMLSRRYPGVEITGVEIDPLMIELGKKYFQIEKINNLKIYNTDAQNFIKNNQTKYSLILIDCYVGMKVPDIFSNAQFVRSLINRAPFVFINKLYWGDDKKETEDYLAKMRTNFSVTTMRTPSNLIASLAKG